MHVPLTLAALATLTTAIVLFRIFWPHFSPATKRALITCATLALTLYLISSLSRWSTTSIRLNASLRWLGFAGYEFFVILFTLFRPRLLTSLIAAILILPILSASALLPLSAFFDHLPQTTIPLQPHLVSIRTIIDRSSMAHSAADLGVYYRSPWLPFLQYRLAETRFFDTQCQAAASYAVLQPDRKSVLLICPAEPAQPTSNAVVEHHPIH